ncbi:hypothetical protein [Blastomonas sp. AAP53]|uniref:hypothetical protein n=1 Tax=Blastomonas sp. AAP53 TaxID=1248760 RepID=UPI0002E1E121|nr:hypothetical protein [Blastomonas sp. AAP53]
MRIALLFPLVLLAACSSEMPADDELVTLDAGTGAQQGSVSASAGGATSSSITGVQAVDAEGPKLEPLLSSAINAAGLDSGSCRFGPAQGALPVLVASKTGGKGIMSIAGKQIDVTASATVADTGGSFAGQGVTLMVSASGKDAAGSTATMQVSDADGPAFVYRDGFWACN